MKTISISISISVIVLALCQPAMAFEEDTLTIWMSTDKGATQLEALAAKFTEDLGIAVVIESPEPLTEKFQQAAATGAGPDIVLWAHDRFGEWAAGGLISPISPSAGVRDGILDTGWDAVSFDGETWGYPVAVEAISLIYNKALVETPPSTIEEITAMKMPNGVSAIMWDYNNTYFSFPLLMAGGGYAFQKVNGTYDATATGVNVEGAIAGAQAIRDLIDNGVMPEGVDYGVMDSAFNKGESAMVINGPWSWSNMRASGIDFGVAPLPSVAGKASPPFVGVYSAALNAASPNKDLAIELLENYMLTDEGLAAWNAESSLGALADISAAKTQSADPNIAATLKGAGMGIPMPSNPEMGKFWSAMEPALAAITGGQQDVKPALDGAAKRILATE